MTLTLSYHQFTKTSMLAESVVHHLFRLLRHRFTKKLSSEQFCRTLYFNALLKLPLILFGAGLKGQGRQTDLLTRSLLYKKQVNAKYITMCLLLLDTQLLFENETKNNTKYSRAHKNETLILMCVFVLNTATLKNMLDCHF